MTTKPATPTPARTLPVRPNLAQLRRQAKELLRKATEGDPQTLAEFRALEAPLKLSSAQFVLARSCGVASWPRLVQACAVADAIWENDIDALKAELVKNPKLLHEPVRAQPDSWGPPLSYAATLGRDQIIQLLSGMGSGSVQRAFERACLQGRLGTAKLLMGLGAEVEKGMVMGPCETLNADGLAFLLELGAELADSQGNSNAPVALILQTYARNPEGKRRCLDLLVQQGVNLPDSPAMALHRGSLPLLEEHLRRDPRAFERQFSHEEIYPPSLGCSEDPSYALHGTPLAGGTLLHMAVDFDEREMIAWMLDHGASPDVKAFVDGDGFGGHTPLFGAVVNQAFRVSRPGSEAIAGQLLEAGADKSVRASLRKALRFVEDESLHEYRDVTPREWGENFHDQSWVNPAALALV